MSILRRKVGRAKSFSARARRRMKAAGAGRVNARPKLILLRFAVAPSRRSLLSMARMRLVCSIAILAAALAIDGRAASSPTPSPTPKKSFLRIKPNVNPSATPSKAGSALGRGAHVGAERPSPTATPKATPRPKHSSKPSASPAKSSPSPTPKPARSTTPKPSPSPAKEKSPAPKSSAPPPPEESPSATPSPAPAKLELTLTKYEPPHGAPGDADYRSARLSYRLNVPSKMEFPAIDFAVESSNGKILQRHFALPKGSASIEPNDNTERTVDLDPEPRDDWTEAFRKSDKAKFTWSIEDQASGAVEKPINKTWP